MTVEVDSTRLAILKMNPSTPQPAGIAFTSRVTGRDVPFTVCKSPSKQDREVAARMVRFNATSGDALDSSVPPTCRYPSNLFLTKKWRALIDFQQFWHNSVNGYAIYAIIAEKHMNLNNVNGSAKIMNIKEFSTSIGVSTATVSRAFSQNGRISEKTRQMILEKAMELGYRANVHARSLTSRSTDSIALFYPSLIKGEPDYFISEVMLGINEKAVSENLHLQIYPIPEDFESYMDFYGDVILGGGVGGIIVIYGTEASTRIIEMAKVGEVACIGIGPIDTAENVISYSIREGARQAGRYFNRLGCKAPVFVGGLNDAPKIDGFKEGLCESSRALILDEGGSTFQHGATAFERLSRNDVCMDAVFCANDVLAIGFIQAAIRKGWNIPDDVAVIGCDDVRLARYYVPALTTVRFHEYDIGERSVINLTRLIEGKSCPADDVIDSELIIRDSA